MKAFIPRIFFFGVLSIFLLISCTKSQNPVDPTLPPTGFPIATETTKPSLTQIIATTPTKTFEPANTAQPSLTPISSLTPAPSDVISLGNITKVTQLAQWGYGAIHRIIYSPDDKFIVLSSAAGLYLINAQTSELVRFIDTGADVGSISITPDGRILAAATRTSVLIYEIADWTLLRTLGEGAVEITFSPDGTLLAVATGSDWEIRRPSSVELWRVSDWSLVQTVTEYVEGVDAMVFSPDGHYLAVSSFMTQVWQIQGDQATLKIPSASCWQIDVSLSFSKDSVFLAIGDANGHACLVRVSDGERLGILEKSYSGNDAGAKVAFSPSGEYLAISSDGKTRIRQRGDWKLLHTVDHSRFLAWSSDEKSFVLLSAENDAEFWDVVTGNFIRSVPLRESGNPLNTIAWSPDGKVIATGNGYRGEVLLWQVENGILYNALENEGMINSLSFSPNSKTLAVGLENDQAKIWEVDGGALLHTLDGALGYGLTSVSFSPNDKLLVLDIAAEPLESDTENVQVWRTDAWEAILTWAVKEDGIVITSVNFSPDGKTIAASAYKGKIRIWSLDSGDLERTLALSNLYELLMTIAYSPDSQLLASATFEGKVGVWRISDGKLLYTFDGPGLKQRIGSGEAYYDCLAWSPNGQIIALAGSDGVIYLIKADNGELLRTLEGHTQWATGVAFSPDGKRLASVSNDGTIRIWGISP